MSATNKTVRGWVEDVLLELTPAHLALVRRDTPAESEEPPVIDFEARSTPE